MTARIIRSKDLASISEWYTARSLPTPDESFLPGIGFIVPGIAAGFLYRTDSKVCFIDGYITNPNKTSAERNQALEVVTEELLLRAVLDGHERAIVLTENEDIVKRAEAWGFNNKVSKIMMVKGIE